MGYQVSAQPLCERDYSFHGKSMLVIQQLVLKLRAHFHLMNFVGKYKLTVFCLWPSLRCFSSSNSWYSVCPRLIFIIAFSRKELPGNSIDQKAPLIKHQISGACGNFKKNPGQLSGDVDVTSTQAKWRRVGVTSTSSHSGTLHSYTHR
jgi:hypothetical protein